MNMPVPAMSQAMTAPIGPVAPAKVRGKENMPAPTMDPTTIPVSANRESFCPDRDATIPSLLRADDRPGSPARCALSLYILRFVAE